MATLDDRENLLQELKPKTAGFTPRPLNKLTNQKLPRTLLNIECNHVLRTSRAESCHGHDSLELQLWLEAGKQRPPYPTTPDESYNSNVWRNFRGNYGFHMNTKGRQTSEVTAAAYPVNIPKPSKVGDYTYERFLREAPGLIKDDRVREIAIQRSTMDKAMMEQLKLRSLSRYPPIDRDGNILPPEHYKRHPHFFKPICDTPTTEYLVEQLRKAAPTPYDYHPNPIKYQPKKSPAWRFNLKSSNPHYKRVLEQYRKNHGVESDTTRAKTCTPATSAAPSEKGSYNLHY